MSPDVSIIIPAYNHEQYVESAVQSALTQTYQSIEIVLLNDGSTDSTGAVCESLAARHPGIRYFSHANMGAHQTINRGIEEASGQFIGVLNSDDLYFPDKIERCMDFAGQDGTIQMICGNVKLINSDGTSPVKDMHMDWQKRGLAFYEACGLLPLSILNENFIMTTSNMFFKKALWHQIGGFQPLRFCHDLEFLMAAFEAGGYYYDKDAFHVMYRVHDANTIQKDPSGVRVEVAAVIASSLIRYNMSLVPNADAGHLRHLIRFLKNRNLSNLIILMMMIYLDLDRKETFYELLCKDEIRGRLTGVETWERKDSAAREQAIAALQTYAQDLQAGNAWLASQRDSWEKAAGECGQAVEELTDRLLETDKKLAEREAALNRIRSHHGMRLVNYLSNRKFF